MNVYLGLGTNQGDKHSNLRNAVNALAKSCGVVIDESSIYESPAWGFKSDESFYNSVILLKTEKSPEELLSSVKKIETELGRKKKIKVGYESRVIDIDILLCDRIVINQDDLIVPHPLIEDRLFVLEPLFELLINRDVSLADFYKTKLSNCNDKSVLKIVKPKQTRKKARSSL